MYASENVRTRWHTSMPLSSGRLRSQKDDVRLERLREIHRRPAVGSLSQLEVLALERRDDDLTDIPVVVDDQHAHGPSIPAARTFLHPWLPLLDGEAHKGAKNTEASPWVPSARNQGSLRWPQPVSREDPV